MRPVLGERNIMAYLVMMAPRLLELKRVCSVEILCTAGASNCG
jgi:hypothetical protein